MITVYSDEHRLRHPRTELSGGELVQPFESPQRAEYVLDRLRAQRVGEIISPTRFGAAPRLRVHDAEYLAFLENAWRDWQAAGYHGEAIPDVWPARRMSRRRPTHITGLMGYYAMAAETSISAGTWEAAVSAADVALTAAEVVRGGARGAFALCRPPGHHAARDLFGGYCFLNNAAIAAQYLRDQGAVRVAIVDVDFHHGNGTQDIFYDREDVLFISLHGEPQNNFPYFSGYAEEVGVGAGEGFTLNLPLPDGTAFLVWQAALGQALNRLEKFRADALIVSLGVDTFEKDPISSFRLKSEDYLSYGRMLGTARLPTLFVMEGGYAVEEIGINAVNVLEGFEGG
jgi:acetoin utilization deacetylase AcuC-like enzyme